MDDVEQRKRRRPLHNNQTSERANITVSVYDRTPDLRDVVELSGLVAQAVEEQ